jgi:hypothetical protein
VGDFACLAAQINRDFMTATRLWVLTLTLAQPGA